MEGLTQGAATSVAWLEVIAGPAKGRRIPVQDEIRFGRDELGEACLENDPWLSPTHALMRHGEHGWTIEDLRSIEGTRVNGHTVRGAVVLNEGDVVEMGSSRLVMVPPNGSTKPPGTDLSRADLKPLWRKRRRAWWIDRLVLLPVAWVIGFLSEGRTAVLLAYTALMLSYHFVCEALTGQTLGKALMGIRVVDMRGRPVRPAAIAARALLLLVDSVLVGLISIAFTGKRQQRLGDLAAGTVVAPAETPFVPARSTRDRLTMWLYPLAWLAPCVLLFLLVPSTAAPPCTESSLRGEGVCKVNGGLLEVRTAGHAIHMDGFETKLLATRSRALRNGRLVSFELEMKNAGSSELDLRDDVHVTLGVLDDSRTQLTLRPHGEPKRRILEPGKTVRLWLRYPVPSSALEELPYAPTHLSVASATEPDRLGWISLWHYAGPEGLHALTDMNG